MADQEAPKKRRRYSREPDLKVIVEGETFNVHSHDLMIASDVFASMLESDMREVEEGQISLPGKSKEEFRTLMQHISTANGEATPDIKKENVEFLLKWADEYQMVGLTSRCERFIQKEIGGEGEKDVIGRLQLANEYRLANLQDQAANMVAGDIFKYRQEVVQFIDNPFVMKLILPALFKAARIELPSELPTKELKAGDVWPLVARSLEAMKSFPELEDLSAMGKVYRACVEAVFDSLPEADFIFGIAVSLGSQGVSIVELKKRHQKRFGEEMVQVAVKALQKSGSMRPGGDTGKYYRVCGQPNKSLVD